MSHDVVCLGEALVDFLPSAKGRRVRDVRAWYPCVGGAPANVAVGVARQGHRSALVGVTGDDEFGYFLRQGLAAEGVDVSQLRHTAEGRTGLGFVSLTNAGERSFTFYRTRSAETFLGGAEAGAALRLMRTAKVLHVGTNSLVQPEARSAVLGAVTAAKRLGRVTSSDPNLRLHLWPKPKVLQGLLEELLPSCTVVKLSDEEVRFVTGTADVGKALTRLERMGVLLAVVTLGAKGAAWAFRGHRGQVPAKRVKVVDTTGAGDGFTAGLLSALTAGALSRDVLESLAPEVVAQAVARGCRVGTEAVTRLGALGVPRS